MELVRGHSGQTGLTPKPMSTEFDYLWRSGGFGTNIAYAKYGPLVDVQIGYDVVTGDARVVSPQYAKYSESILGFLRGHAARQGWQPTNECFNASGIGSNVMLCCRLTIGTRTPIEYNRTLESLQESTQDLRTTIVETVPVLSTQVRNFSESLLALEELNYNSTIQLNLSLDVLRGIQDRAEQRVLDIEVMQEKLEADFNATEARGEELNKLIGETEEDRKRMRRQQERFQNLTDSWPPLEEYSDEDSSVSLADIMAGLGNAVFGTNSVLGPIGQKLFDVVDKVTNLPGDALDTIDGLGDNAADALSGIGDGFGNLLSIGPQIIGWLLHAFTVTAVIVLFIRGGGVSGLKASKMLGEERRNFIKKGKDAAKEAYKSRGIANAADPQGNIQTGYVPEGGPPNYTSVLVSPSAPPKGAMSNNLPVPKEQIPK